MTEAGDRGGERGPIRCVGLELEHGGRTHTGRAGRAPPHATIVDGQFHLVRLRHHVVTKPGCTVILVG